MGTYSSGFSGERGLHGGGMSSYGQGSQMGRHAGRGPRGYQRSDERIREDVNEHLTQHPEIDATEIEVQVHQGEVTLRGTVENRQEKRAAEDIVERVSGVRDVKNEIRVQASHASSTHSSSGSTGTGSSGSASQASGGSSTGSGSTGGASQSGTSSLGGSSSGTSSTSGGSKTSNK